MCTLKPQAQPVFLVRAFKWCKPFCMVNCYYTFTNTLTDITKYILQSGKSQQNIIGAYEINTKNSMHAAQTLEIGLV